MHLVISCSLSESSNSRMMAEYAYNLYCKNAKIIDLQKISFPTDVRHNSPIDFQLKFLNSNNEYAQDLNSGLVQIFNALADLTSQISLYFMGGGETDGVSRKEHGKNAVENAKILKHNTEELIGD